MQQDAHYPLNERAVLEDDPNLGWRLASLAGKVIRQLRYPMSSAQLPSNFFFSRTCRHTPSEDL